MGLPEWGVFYQIGVQSPSIIGDWALINYYLCAFLIIDLIDEGIVIFLEKRNFRVSSEWEKKGHKGGVKRKRC